MSDASMQKTTQCNPTQRREAPTYVPNVDIVETGDAFILSAEMPGARADAIDVTFEQGTLTLRAQIEPRGGGERWLVREYGVGDYERTLEVGDAVEPDGISADYRQGVLVLRLPKQERARSRKIDVRSA